MKRLYLFILTLIALNLYSQTEYIDRQFGLASGTSQYYYNTNQFYMVETNNVLYMFYINYDSSDPCYVKSTDHGLTWGSEVVIESGVTCAAIAIWFDGWSGINSGIINIAYIEIDVDDVFFESLNTNNDSFGSKYTIIAYASGTNNDYSYQCSITKSFGGELYCVGNMAIGTSYDWYRRSNNNGESWSNMTDLTLTANGDDLHIYPDFQVDEDDCILFKHEFTGSDTLELHRYDASNNSWSKTILGIGTRPLASSVNQPSVNESSVTIDTINSKLYITLWSAIDGANAYLQAWSITSSDTNKLTNVVTAGAGGDINCTALSVNSSGLLTAFYCGASDGSEYIAGPNVGVNVYYKQSSDGGITWGSETKMGNNLKNIKWITSIPMCNNLYIRWGDYYACHGILTRPKIKKINGISPY